MIKYCYKLFIRSRKVRFYAKFPQEEKGLHYLKVFLYSSHLFQWLLDIGEVKWSNILFHLVGPTITWLILKLYMMFCNVGRNIWPCIYTKAELSSVISIYCGQIIHLHDRSTKPRANLVVWKFTWHSNAFSWRIFT